MPQKKYPIPAICLSCQEPVYVFFGKKAQKEYLTNSPSYKDFHSCYQAAWAPRKEAKALRETTPEPVERKVEAEFETAEARMDFDRTYKLVELSISKLRKCHNKTIPQLPDYESLEYFISGKVECELGADLPKIVREKFAEITHLIDQEIEQDRIRLTGQNKK